MAEGVSGEDRVMMIEGRVLRPEDRIYDLVDVVERKTKLAVVDTGIHDEILKRTEVIAEKIAREIIPAIAERVIREEIEKLKKEA